MAAIPLRVDFVGLMARMQSTICFPPSWTLPLMCVVRAFHIFNELIALKGLHVQYLVEPEPRGLLGSKRCKALPGRLRP